MMYLHYNEKEFQAFITNTSAISNIDKHFIEKDYYVFIALKNIVNKISSQVIFKGGTSLSKAYYVINRFSEDIDLCLPEEKIKSGGARKRLVEATISSIENIGLTAIPIGEVQRHGDYNAFKAKYNPIEVEHDEIESYIKIEIAHRVREYPVELKKIRCFIEQYLGLVAPNSIKKYGLQPFEVYTVSMYRTFIDKLFAIADYYMTGKAYRYSRHLYDVYKIIQNIDWNNSTLVNGILTLKESVGLERQSSKKCLSAQPGVNLKKVLYEALQSDFYKEDYQGVTRPMLFEYVAYEDCKKTILQLLEMLDIK